MNPLHNDSDPEDDPLEIIGVDAPLHGTLEFDSESITYTPNEGYSGEDSFTYYIVDPWRPQSKNYATSVVVSLLVKDPITLGSSTLAAITVQDTDEGAYPRAIARC